MSASPSTRSPTTPPVSGSDALVRFDATEEQRQLQAVTRRFLESSVPLPTVRLLAEKSPAGFDRDWWRQAADLGWLGLLVPEAWGGSDVAGSGLADAVVVAEERGRLVSPGPYLSSCVAAWTLAQAEQRTVAGRAVLEATLSGEAICAWVLGERTPWPGSPPAVRAVRRGPDLELTGMARAIESGADADHLVVAVQLEDQVAHVLVRSDAVGLQRTRLGSLDLVHRYADLHFDDAVVPSTAVVIGPDHGLSVLHRQTRLATVLQCAEMVGAASRVLQMTLDNARGRHSFGRPLASYQVLKHRFADMKLWLEASFAAVDGAVEAVARDDDAATDAVSAAKLYVGRHCTDLVQDCIQIHGGMGVTWEHDLHMYLRRMTTERQLMGTPADHARHLASRLAL
jgi:alkylation response protein AidB-like acyl-CoA dehydrogenase